MLMTILLVDTHTIRQQSTALLLQELSPEFHVMSAADPLRAAKYAFNNPVDVLFTELSMKRMSGIQLCDFVGEKNPNVRICLTANRQEFADCPETFDGSQCPYPQMRKARPVFGGTRFVLERDYVRRHAGSCSGSVQR